MKVNLGAGKVPKPKAEGWQNWDKFTFPQFDPSEFEYKQIDLFRFPWNCADNTVDEIFASHIIEHVPHETKPSPLLARFYNDRAYHMSGVFKDGIEARWGEICDLDGFFAFFAEVWRVCKPDALVNIVCPFGYSRGSFQDPTHTRYIVPPTFYYLTRDPNNANWDYHLPFEFKLVDVQILLNPELGGLTREQADSEEMKWEIAHSWDICRDLQATLQVVK